MRLLKKLSIAALAFSLSVPAGFAKIYPDDFLVPMGLSDDGVMTDDPTMQEVVSPTGEVTLAIPPIEEGRLTRAQFIEAVALRLYPGIEHVNCFAAIASSVPVDYTLIFKDVPVDASYASSVCVAMHNGLVRGYADGTFRPDQQITVAEAASVLARINLHPRARKGKEAWYNPSMEAMRGVDREFTMRAWDVMTGAQLRHALCVLAAETPTLDPMGECLDM